MAQNIFYSLYLMYPKSRYIFKDDFKDSLLALFAFLFNGLVITSKLTTHWTLDLGLGDILDDEEKVYKTIKESRKLIRTDEQV